MKIILNHKSKAKITEDIINSLSLVKSYLEIKGLQEYIDFEDILMQLEQTIIKVQKLYNELNYIFRKLSEKK